MKRLIDIVGAGLLLVLFAPLMLLLALSVKVGSRGPSVYRHERMGKGAKPISVLKFRTMHVVEGGPSITATGDPRVTRVGSVLRRTKLDELPQLVNVLRGDMSFVGPRPEVAEYVNRFPDEYAELLTVRPGITDSASLEFRNEQDLLAEHADDEDFYTRCVMPQKLALSLADIQSGSVRHDLSLMARTVAAIVR